MPELLRLRWLGGLALLACLFPSFVRADGRQVIGHSVEGRPIILFRDSAQDPALKLLVIGDIHGNEAAGMRITRQLIAASAPARTELLVVPTINPDGLAANTRGNAHGVDLNRNFPFHWRPLQSGEYSGPRPLSEPESRASERLVLDERPDVTIWFHQPFGLIDRPNGSLFAARRFSEMTGLPLVRLRGTYPGSVSRWQNHRFPGATAFVAELPNMVSYHLVTRSVTAIHTLASELASTDLDGKVASPGR